MIAERVTLSTVAPAASRRGEDEDQPTGGSPANVIAVSAAAESAIALWAQHQPAPLDPVRDRAASSVPSHDRDQFDDAERPDERRRVGRACTPGTGSRPARPATPGR